MHCCIIRKLTMISTMILRPWIFGCILSSLEPAECLPLRTGVTDAIVVVEGRRAALWTETGCGPLMSVRVHLRVIFTEIGYTIGFEFFICWTYNGCRVLFSSDLSSPLVIYSKLSISR